MTESFAFGMSQVSFKFCNGEKEIYKQKNYHLNPKAILAWTGSRVHGLANALWLPWHEKEKRILCSETKLIISLEQLLEFFTMGELRAIISPVFLFVML